MIIFLILIILNIFVISMFVLQINFAFAHSWIKLPFILICDNGFIKKNIANKYMYTLA